MQPTDIRQLAQENKTALQAYVQSGSASGYSHPYKLDAMALLSMQEPADLCVLLGVTKYEISRAMNKPEYMHYAIPKKRGGERHIFAPEYNLKAIQRRLNRFLQADYLWIKPEEVHGFVTNPDYLERPCGIISNAAVHIGKKHILNIDLKDFFPSISARRIKELFLSPRFGFDEQMATALTLLTTFKRQLPTGASTSPVLSNFVCIELDAALRDFCRENGLQYTRYADDLTFSSDMVISDEAIGEIRRLIGENGFEVNEKKLRIRSANRKQTVTGLVVNEKVNVDRKLIRKIRAMIHDLNANGINAATKRHFGLQAKVRSRDRELFRARLKGYIEFVGQVRGKDDPVYMKLIRSFSEYHN